MIILRKLIFFVYCGSICNNRVQQFANFGAPSFHPRKCEDFFITSNYPQYGTNFWGNSANNYGFGMTNIAGNIENMQNNPTPIPMTTAAPQMTTQPITPQVQHQPNTSAWDTVKQWGETATNGLMAVPKKIWETGEGLGELAADIKIAYDYWIKMYQKQK